ncbi:PLP-dependent aminotransferase family protein [Clostridium sp. SHJSY1]|uniref:aminotransferase-like domain-containing protein n=1 Tax=Clostridium sp. SHJSY1 TaxID=2942483 RepID=UPI0028760A53|nr:PLP-dependent aminotransferase family protein [Clostridium sp. SHJSY1]MDS0528304.1 PLP-dependent aminotransferase family protein [Clostridium sp. SHJSY1]
MKSIYMIIADDINESIQKGELKPGSKIPSIRNLTTKYNCSKNSVIKAYETLKNNHIIYSSPKSGFFVAETLSRNNVECDTINFYSGNTIIGNMNTEDLKHCLKWAGDIYSNYSLESGIYGIDSLRDRLVTHLSNSQIFTSRDNIFINMGICQTLSALNMLELPNRKTTILIEQPTYAMYIEGLKNSNVPVIGIERNENGIDLKELERIFKEESIKFFYVIPRHHNPLGTTLNKSQRKTIAKLAKKYDVYIVEDDYFSCIDEDRNYDPIFSYSDHEHVFYISSFSKIMPWMRIGFIVSPTNLIKSLKKCMYKIHFFSYPTPSLLSQATLEIYLQSKLLYKHTSLVTADLKSKYDILNESLKSLEYLDVKVIKSHSGFYCYLELPEWVNEDILVKELEKSKVIVGHGKRFYFYDKFYKKGIRLSIASVSNHDIKKGISVIEEKLKMFS